MKTNEPPSYGTFVFPKTDVPFNGQSYMKFDMDISSVSILGGASVNTKSLGTWSAGLSTNISITQPAEMKNLTAAVVYRIYTVVVSSKYYYNYIVCTQKRSYFLQQPPFIIKDSASPRGYKGYCIDLIDDIANKVGFDYDIKEVEDGKFGSLNEKVTLLF